VTEPVTCTQLQEWSWVVACVTGLASEASKMKPDPPTPSSEPLGEGPSLVPWGGGGGSCSLLCPPLTCPGQLFTLTSVPPAGQARSPGPPSLGCPSLSLSLSLSPSLFPCLSVCLSLSFFVSLPPWFTLPFWDTQSICPSVCQGCTLASLAPVVGNGQVRAPPPAPFWTLSQGH
jgi:hypothetical protein